MRRFSSEGSLLDLDFLPWKRVELRDKGYSQDGESGTYTPQLSLSDSDGHMVVVPPGLDGEEAGASGSPQKAPLTKEFSVSAENVSGRGQEDRAGSYLRVVSLGDGCRAYSDGQLAPAAAGGRSSEREDMEEGPSRHSSSYSSSSTAASATSRYHHRQHAKARLTSAKLHLKNLFGQSPHSSHTNLSSEHKDIQNSSREKKSRLPFLRQWSQVGHGSARLSREEVLGWAESVDVLLSSRVGVAVFGAFLRSEFSEENLQFYLACEQFCHSSTNFTLQRRARDIYATYIQPGAPREVNLDSKTRDLTLQLLQAPSHSSLSHAQKRIHYLLESDCYPRFLQSPVYLSLLE
ncbi:regulator of G-protein signaling 3 isoform X1 [Anguilla rostrata]|uniref:regulator of G-protein signaling 3 isoform X1 n=1 Tax=Anguilla rostrata TaxID=7938 RepID=UPI0030D5317E